MAKLTTGTTWVNAETITSTKLNNAVNAATIADIVNADIKSDAAIVDTKLAQITTASKVSGAALTGLASIPAGAGAIPAANLTAVASKALDNLASVAINTSLISDTDNTDDLGSDAKKWKDLYTKDIKGLNGSINPTNLLSNGDFEDWSAGAAAAPDGWTTFGGGLSIAREASIIKLGTYSAKLTRGGNNCVIIQAIHTTKGINYWKGRTVTLGCWVYATVADRVYIQVGDDAVGTTKSSYHTGDSTWQWMSVTLTVNTSSTKLEAYFGIDTGDTSAYFDGAMLVEGSSAFAFADKPLAYNDSRIKIGTFTRDITAATGDVSYTAIGFIPKAISFFGGIDGTKIGSFNGYDDGTNHYAIGSSSGEVAGQNGVQLLKSIFLEEGAGKFQIAYVKSFDSDGFTLTWEKVGSPSAGTAYIFCIAFR